MSELTGYQKEAAVNAIEEMSELTKVLAKMLRFGRTDETGKPRSTLEEELGDVCLMMDLIHKHFDIDPADTEERKQDKRDKLGVWSSLYG